VDVDVVVVVVANGDRDRDRDRCGEPVTDRSEMNRGSRVRESIHVSMDEPSASRAIEEHPIEPSAIRLCVIVVALDHVALVSATPPAAARAVRAEEPRGVLTHRARTTFFVDGDRARARKEPPLKSIARWCFEHGRAVGG